MATDLKDQPSFSPRRKWSMGLNLAIRVIAVLAVVVMVNYLSGRYFQRWRLSAQTRVSLASRSENLLKTFTNQVKITLYYDKEDPFYSTILELVNEFHNVNPRIRVITVDPLRDIG